MRYVAWIPQEDNDCTVRALSVAGNMPYRRAYQMMAMGGRKPNQPRAMPYGLDIYMANDGDIRYCPPTHRIRLKAFLATLPTTGRFIIKIRNHVFAVVDGCVFDDGIRHGNYIVTEAWELFPTG